MPTQDTAETETTYATVKEAAEALYKATERATRDDGKEYVRVRDGSPQWMQDACHAAHGDLFPDDWRYRFIEDCAEVLSENNDRENAEERLGFAEDSYPYNHERIDWLGSHGHRPDYCDTARDEFGMANPDILDLIAWGMDAERHEVFALLYDFLEEMVG